MHIIYSLRMPPDQTLDSIEIVFAGQSYSSAIKNRTSSCYNDIIEIPAGVLNKD